MNTKEFLHYLEQQAKKGIDTDIILDSAYQLLLSEEENKNTSVK